jgi:tetratricopeptide (TPR) repeat protein
MYMRAQALATRDDDNALRLLNQAIARDPGFARAHAAKAAVLFYRQALDFRLTWIADEIEETTRRALALDPGLAVVKAIAGSAHALHARWIEAEECFEQAFALDPEEPVGYNLHSMGLAAAVGHYRAALVSARRAYELAPALVASSLQLTGCLQFAGYDSEALDQMRIAVELGHLPDAPPLPIMSSQAARHAGRLDEARDEILKIFPPDIRAAGADAAVARIYAAFADPAQTEAAVEALAALQRDPRLSERLASWPLSIMCLHWHAMLGAQDHAYALAEQILQEFEATGRLNVVGHLPSLWMPEVRAFRQDPRFQDFVRRLNFIPYWKRYGPPDGHELKGDALVVP